MRSLKTGASWLPSFSENGVNSGLVDVGSGDANFDGAIDAIDYAVFRGAGNFNVIDDWRANFGSHARVPAKHASLVVAKLTDNSMPANANRQAVEQVFNGMGAEVDEHLGEAGMVLARIPSGSTALEEIANWRIVGATDEIVGGQITTANPAVGKVIGRGGCSGTLIAENFVVTAAHCLEGVADAGARFIFDDGREFQSILIFIHPKYKSNGQFIGPNDIALVKLENSVTGVAPMEIDRAGVPIGEPVTMVGYGYGGDIGGPVDNRFGTNREGFNDVDAIDAVFDGTITLITEAGEATTASGDSGGPSLVNRGGELVVASVNSGGTVAKVIGGRSVQTRVAAYAPWIDATIASETPEPPKPAPPLPPALPSWITDTGGGILSIAGSLGNDRIHLERIGDNVEVTFNNRIATLWRYALSKVS